MAQLGSSNPNSLPGIVTDQPEIYESEPALSDDTGINDLDLIDEHTDEAIAVIEVPIKHAFSYFADRENEIAKFYVQRHGEYKISCDRPEDETDVEKYHRLVSEVNELLNKFQANASSQTTKSQLSIEGSLNNPALTSNLEVLSRQLKTLESAAEDDSLNPTKSEFKNIELKLEKFDPKASIKEELHDVLSKRLELTDDTAKIIRMSALERRLNLLETLLGYSDSKAQALFKTTKCENLTEVAETLGSWLSLYNQENVQRMGRELDYLSQRLEKINEQAIGSTDEGKLDPQTRKKLDHLCSMVTSTDKHRAMVPTIIHRLNAMEELQQKAAQVTTTVSYLEQVQSQIVESLQSNKEELSSLNDMFGKNLELIKEFSADIDTRISAIREKDK